jgi:hypothetical protein
MITVRQYLKIMPLKYTERKRYVKVVKIERRALHSSPPRIQFPGDPGA